MVQVLGILYIRVPVGGGCSVVSDPSLLTLSTHFPHSTPASCQLKPDKIYLIIRADRDVLSALRKYQVAERAVGQGARWISFGRVTEAQVRSRLARFAVSGGQ